MWTLTLVWIVVTIGTIVIAKFNLDLLYFFIKIVRSKFSGNSQNKLKTDVDNKIDSRITYVDSSKRD